MNRLAKEKSAYLRHSADQKIDWYPWSEEAFERARREDKPVFLSSGAVWCHWCHVMAKESFEKDEIVRLLNENFINIKLDRDERPDLDKRYQQAAVAMGSGGGWPLSVFLTPDKTPFFGGTYFPPEDADGRPGFKKVLTSVADFYKLKKGEISEYTDRLMGYLKPSPLLASPLREDALSEAVSTILSEVDPNNGGFGTSPKFPAPGAMEFLINRAYFTDRKDITLSVEKTLEAMAKGGIHDQIGGGFHRYSTDEAWIIPHFEKMADDNAWLLRNYLNGFSLLGNGYFGMTARGIIRFVWDILSDPEGGFYASQDADVTPDDEGGYFTWTGKDFHEALTGKELDVLSLHLLHERGAMHHDRAKMTVFVVMEPEEIARKLGMDVRTVHHTIAEGKKKLLRERMKRKPPLVDKCIYTSLNGLFITSYLLAYRTFGEKRVRDFALKSLERVSAMHMTDNSLYHAEGVKGMLDDYVNFSEAYISAYEVAGRAEYLERAESLMEICIGDFLDKDEGGFFDTSEEVLGIRLKGVEDIPHPSANSTAIILLLKLYHMTGREEYKKHAERALGIFYPDAERLGVHSGYYFCALDAYFNMLRLTVNAHPEGILACSALAEFGPYTAFIYGENHGYVLPCLRGQCYEPIKDPREMKKLEEIRKLI